MSSRMFEILVDTAQYYISNPERRASDECGYVSYKMDDGRRCAIGRYMSDFELKGVEDASNCSIKLISTPKALTGLDVDWLHELQKWHDTGTYWRPGLTGEGYEFLYELAKYLSAAERLLVEQEFPIRCIRCKTRVGLSDVEDYFAYCPEHDEDLYPFEVEGDRE